MSSRAHRSGWILRLWHQGESLGVSAQSDCLFRSTLCLKLVGFLDLTLFSGNLFATAADLAHFSNTAQHWYARLVAPGGQGNDIPLMKQKRQHLHSFFSWSSQRDTVSVKILGPILYSTALGGGGNRRTISVNPIQASMKTRDVF